jgi:hypothetical protein
MNLAMSRRRSARPKEVFLSHSSKDARFTERFANVLVSHGINVFLSKRHIGGAQQWHDQIGAALKRCDWFVVILSPYSVSSKWVKHELIYALQANRYKERILPLLYKTCDADKLSWTLSAFQRIDFRHDFEAGCRYVLGMWQLEYHPNASKPGSLAKRRVGRGRGRLPQRAS